MTIDKHFISPFHLFRDMAVIYRSLVVALWLETLSVWPCKKANRLARLAKLCISRVTGVSRVACHIGSPFSSTALHRRIKYERYSFDCLCPSVIPIPPVL